MRRLALVGDVLKHLGTTARQLIIDALEATYGRDNIANRADGTYDFVHHGISGGRTEAN